MTQLNLECLLVGLDAGAPDPAVLARLDQLRMALGCRVHLVHVVESRQLSALEADSGRRAGLVAQLSEAASAVLRPLATTLVASGTPTTVEVATGVPAETLLTIAAREAAAVVLAGAGRAAWRPQLLGSPAQALAQGATRPLLLVGAKGGGCYRHVLAGYRDRDGDGAALDLARTLAPTARWSVVHAIDTRALTMPGLNSGDSGYREQLRDQAREAVRARLAPELAEALADRQHELVLELGHPAAVLAEAVARLAPDLLVLGRGGQGSLSRLLLGSVSAALAQMCTCDLLLVP